MTTSGDPPHIGQSHVDALYYTARTVVFADVVESVRLIQRDEIAAARRMRGLLLEAAEEIVPRNHGHLLQRLGDGLMLDFTHPRDAAACARALHQRCAELSANLAPEDRLLLRVGIHAADILTDDVAFYGHGVNVASRLAGLAGPGETVISAAARDALTAGLDGDIEDLGSCHLKNIAAPMRAYRLGPRNVLSPLPDDQIRLRPTLAVVPLALRGGGREYLPVGEIIADEVIAALSQAPELRVVSRLSTTAFRGRKLQLVDVRTYLGATYVLSGGYRVVGDMLIVNVELADTRTNEVMWAKSLRGKLSGLFAQDGELIGALVAGASDAIMSTEIVQTATRSLPTLDAGTLLLGGIGLMHRSDRRDFDKSRRAFEHLIEFFRHGVEPHHVILTVLLGAQRVRVRHERGKLVLHAVKLIDRMIVKLPFLSFHLVCDVPIEDVSGEFLRLRLSIQPVFLQLPEILFPPVDNRLLMRRRGVIELAVVTSNPELFDQAE